MLAAADADDVGRRVLVEVLDPDETRSVGLQGLAVAIAPIDLQGDVDAVVTLNYEGFRGLFGGDWAERLGASVGVGCAWDATVPGYAALVPGCALEPTPSESGNDLVAGVVSLTATFVESTYLTGPLGIDAPAGLASAATSPHSVTGGAGSGATVAGLLAGLSGSSGSFAASPLAANGSWSQGGASGGFHWSYPFTLPDVGRGGPVPAFGLSYSSQAVDAMTSNTSSQASPAGLGWSLGGEAFVERSYAPCAAVGGGAADLCWDGWQVSVVLDGVSSRLVPIDPGFSEWRLEHDNGWRVHRRTDGPTTGEPGLFDADGEWWELTTLDGTRYRFGHGTHGTATRSTWAVPMRASRPGDPCHSSPGRVCEQGWRWMLDQVVDPIGISQVRSYRTEVNHYGSPLRAYTRGGLIDTVWWGIAPGGSVHDASYRMEFESSWRCHTLDPACGEPAPGWGHLFPEVPTDLMCPAATACSHRVPSFFTALRLHTVATFSLGQPVDRWELAHEVVGGLPRMWLRAVQRVSPVADEHGKFPRLPAVRFESFGSRLANRWDANPADGRSAMAFHRVDTIRDELGGQTVVTYGQPSGCTGEPAAGWDHNTQNCFPDMWAPPGGTPGWGVFNVYVVTAVTRGTIAPGAGFTDRVSWAGAPSTTTYEYLGDGQGYMDGAGWRHAQRRGTAFRSQSWSVWRGYPRVVAITAASPGATGDDVTRTVSHYFRGLDGNRLAGGGTQAVSAIAPRVTAAGAPVSLPDSDAQAGRLLAEFVTNGAGTVESVTTTVPGDPSEIPGVPLGGHASSGFVEEQLAARRFGTVDVWTRTDDWAAVTHTTTHLDERGVPTRVVEHGDIATADDDRCTLTEYEVHGPVLDRPDRIDVHDGAACAGLVTSTEFDWDAQGRLLRERPGANGGLGIEWRAAYSGSWGRVSQVLDPAGTPTHVAYATIAGGERTTVTDVLGQQSRTEVDRRGNTVRQVDPHGHVTRAVFDVFGRITAWWAPSESDPNQPTGRVRYGLFVGNGNPAPPYLGVFRHEGAVVATELLTGAAGEYTRTVAYVDAVGRTVETHRLNHAGQRLVAGTVFDGRGAAERAIDAFVSPATLGTGLAGSTPRAVGVGAMDRPLETRTRYDAVGRPVRSATVVDGAEVAVSTSTYTGFATEVDPAGATGPITTTSDAFGNATRREPTGGAIESSRFDAANRLFEHTVGSSPTTFAFDAAGRPTREVDANRGRTWFEHPAWNETVRRDAAGNEVRTVLDPLGRPVERWARRFDELAERLVAEWAYDDAHRPSRAASYSDEFRYEVFTSGYDEADRPRQSRYVITDLHGPGAGDDELVDEYVEAIDGFTPTGAPTSVTYGPLGATPTETLDHTATPGGLPMTTTLTAGGSSVGLASSTYDTLDRITARTLGDGPDQITRTYAYDGQRRLWSLRAQLTDGTVVQHDDSTYDLAGNVAAIDHRVIGGGVPGDAHRKCFVHDEQAQLVRAYTTAVGTPCAAATPGDVNAGPAGSGYDHSWNLGESGAILGADHLSAASDRHLNYGYGVDGAHPDFVSRIGIAEAGTAESVAGIGATPFGARSGSVPVPNEAGFLEPLEVPFRLYDSRSQPTWPDLPPGGDVLLDLADVAGLADPNGITAVMVNLAIVDAAGRGSLSAWPDGSPRPGTPYISAEDGDPIENLAIVAVEGGRLRVGASDVALDAFVDVLAVYRHTDVAVEEGRVIPVLPYRAYDSRPADHGQLHGQGDGPLPDGPAPEDRYRLVSVAGPELPAGDVVKGVIATLMVDNIDGAGHFSVLPADWDPLLDGCDTDANPATPSVPCTSTLNAEPGHPRANQVATMITIDDLREFQVFSQSGGDVIVDVVAYITGPGAPESEVGLYAQLDASLALWTATTSSTEPVEVREVAGSGGVPAGAIAVTGVVGLAARQNSHATVYPADDTGDPAPATSSVNALAGEVQYAHFTTGLDNGHLGVRAPFDVNVPVTITGFYVSELPDPDSEPLHLEPAVLDYDAQQQLTLTATHSGAVTRYDYWPDGSRAAVHHPPGTFAGVGHAATFYVGATEAVRDLDHDVWVTSTRTYTHAGAAVAVRVDDGELTWLLGDHQGSITTSVIAGVAAAHLYTPYGTPRTAGPEATTRGWLNQHHDGSGLVYLNHRYHDPLLGVFTSVDPLLTTTWQPYVYANANPTTFSDPTGLEPGCGMTAVSSGSCEASFTGNLCADDSYYMCRRRDGGPNKGSTYLAGYGPRAIAEFSRGIGLLRVATSGGTVQVPPSWLGPAVSSGEFVLEASVDDWTLQITRTVSTSWELSLYETPDGMALVLRGEQTTMVRSTLRPASYSGLADALSKSLGATGLALDGYSVGVAFVEGWNAYRNASGPTRNTALVAPVVESVFSAGGAYLAGTSAGSLCVAGGATAPLAAGCVFISSYMGGKAGEQIGKMSTSSGCFYLDGWCNMSRFIYEARSRGG